MEMKFSERFKERLNVLKEPIKNTAVQYAETIFRQGNCSPEEAIERGITKAELDKRNL